MKRIIALTAIALSLGACQHRGPYRPVYIQESYTPIPMIQPYYLPTHGQRTTTNCTYSYGTQHCTHY